MHSHCHMPSLAEEQEISLLIIWFVMEVKDSSYIASFNQITIVIIRRMLVSNVKVKVKVINA